MRIYLSPSRQPANTYAAGKTNEQVQMHRVADACASALRVAGHTVAVALATQTLEGRVREANNGKFDFYVAIHSNAGGGKGVEVLAPSRHASDSTVKAIYAALDFLSPNKGRGIKVRDNLYELNAANMPVCLPEVEFHDNAAGAQWIIDNAVKIGQAIASAFALAPKSASAPTPAPAQTGLTVNSIPELKRGAKSQTVGALQALLNLRGAKPALKIDNDFGALTHAALATYQRSRGLIADSICGPNTWRALLGV